MEFWKRYLFRRALLEDALANADKAERRAKQETATDTLSPDVQVIQTEQPKKSSEAETLPEDKTPESEDALKEDIKWESEDIECDVELSEEEQARLLAEYEAEIQEREKRKSQIGDTKSKPQNAKTENKAKAPAKATTPAKGSKTSPQKAAPQKTTTPPKSAGNKKTGAAEAKKQPQKTATDTAKTDDKLNVEKNHFPKEDASSNSDESWEKEFDLEEQ